MTQHHEGLKLESDLAILRWQRLMEQVLRAQSISTSDEAPGLLASGEPAFALLTLSAGWKDTTCATRCPI